MKRLTLWLVLLTAIPSAAFAQERRMNVSAMDPPVIDEQIWELSLQGGWLFPRKDDRFDDTGFGAARLTADVSPYAAVGVESGWMRFRDEIGGTKYGNIDGIPALGIIQLKAPAMVNQSRVVPYVLGGAGVIFWNYRESGPLQNAGVKVDTETHFAAKGAVGMDFYMNRNWALFIEGSYLFSRFAPDIDGGGTVVTTKANSGAFLAGGGIKLRF